MRKAKISRAGPSETEFLSSIASPNLQKHCRILARLASDAHSVKRSPWGLNCRKQFSSVTLIAILFPAIIVTFESHQFYHELDKLSPLPFKRDTLRSYELVIAVFCGRHADKLVER